MPEVRVCLWDTSTLLPQDSTRKVTSRSFSHAKQKGSARSLHRGVEEGVSSHQPKTRARTPPPSQPAPNQSCSQSARPPCMREQNLRAVPQVRSGLPSARVPIARQEVESCTSRCVRRQHSSTGTSGSQSIPFPMKLKFAQTALAAETDLAVVL